MSPFVRLEGDTASSETNSTVLQEPQAECHEDRPSTPELCPVHNLDTSEDTSEDGIGERNSLTRFTIVPEEFDNSTGEQANFSADSVDSVSHRPVVCSFNQYGRLLHSREEAQEFLRVARIELLAKLPLHHPLWDRMKKDGFLKADESMQEDMSDGGAALKEVMGGDGWWNEEDDDAEDKSSEDESDEDDEKAAEDAAVEVTPIEDTAAESAGSWSLRDAFSESSEEE
ncbi:hypothetical protein EPUS_02415 [Endocarpon pusillum Z07020]|uniref:Uncharacterized protein n=1 Tax=Endocarpon pusillum (strain Z07020 / HMAS-L-300199) TaxID=1263415 RepID=U1GFK6_ENDPU|nr:uncharacterized protein EPUS_02415 [Endocarpon pusillum Z07020]ERF70893.1 hypothetical protein EPUS_02415 [Endocarpon pusillum Z07020]